MTFEAWLAQQTQPAHPGTNAQNLGIVIEGTLPCGCIGPEMVRCSCEERHLQARIDWLRRKDDLFTNLGPEPVATKWKCTCASVYDPRPGMRHLIIHPDGKVWHWSCGKVIGQITAVAQPGMVCA